MRLGPVSGVVRTIAEALATYRQRVRPRLLALAARRRRATAKAAVAPAKTHSPSPRRRTATPEPIPPPSVPDVAPEWTAAEIDWDSPDLLVDGGAGEEGWAAFRRDVVEQAMAKRAEAVRAQMLAEGRRPGRRDDSRSKDERRVDAAGALMSARPHGGNQWTRRRAAAAAPPAP